MNSFGWTGESSDVAAFMLVLSKVMESYCGEGVAGRNIHSPEQSVKPEVPYPQDESSGLSPCPAQLGVCLPLQMSHLTEAQSQSPK